MNIGIIGAGAIARYACGKLQDRGHTVSVVLSRRRGDGRDDGVFQDIPMVRCVEDMPEGIEHVIDCAGHGALKEHGAKILACGMPLTTVSIGALADEDLHQQLDKAASTGGARLHLVSGAIGSLDCLRAARVGGLEQVIYEGRKPASCWRGTPAEDLLDLEDLPPEGAVHFEGSARGAATSYPKNANVAAAVALAGLGFDRTRVRLIADPQATENIHEVEASGDFGNFTFRILGRTVPDNPKSSALAAMSVISSLEQETDRIWF
ncbi:MAG: aspartate dehydrogenase [Pseudomonadota bacterium]